MGSVVKKTFRPFLLLLLHPLPLPFHPVMGWGHP